jgi:hypothetical protein
MMDLRGSISHGACSELSFSPADKLPVHQIAWQAFNSAE